MGLKQAYKNSLEIVGHDSEPTMAKRAQQRGALDRVSWNLFTAVEKAHIVVLATPVMATRDIMELIGSRLMEGCVVTDTGNTKEAILEWADEYLPNTVSFIGGDPLTSKSAPGVENAEANLFQDVLYCLIPSPNAHRDAVRVVTDMVKALGARPYFINAAEHDSYAAAVNHLPILVSAALMSSLSKSPGWRDISKHAAAPLEAISQLASVYPLDNLDACITNKEALLHWVDQLILELYQYRNLLHEDTEGLGRSFTEAFEGRERWLSRRAAGFPNEEQVAVDMPGFTERMGDLLVGHRLMERYRQLENRFQGRGSGRRRPSE